jgi:hypothetical protein
MRRTVLVLLLASCPGEEMPPPEELPLSLDRLCAEIARVDCERIDACGGLYAPFDASLCQTRQAQLVCAPIAGAMQAAIDEGTLTYFELSARECRDAVADLPCTAGFRYELLDLPECRAMVSGTGMDGDRCPLGLACAEGFHCVAEDGCPGRCRAFRQNNETCGIGQLCAPDLFCSVTGMRCRARVDLQGTCEQSLDNNACRDGSWCDASNPADLRCVPVRGRNSGCTSSFQCIAGARCIRNLCSAGEPGDACVETNDCRGDLACIGGDCVVPAGVMETCNAGAPCAEGLVCTSSAGVDSCQAQPIAGQPCGMGCYLSHCRDGTCASHVRAEESCADTMECFPGHACEESVCKVEPIACNE